MSKYVCVHLHFYQPPRENPWLDKIEKQDSAAPFHDWNERISAECYRENGRSKIINGRNFVIGVSNNYSKISFNFGPTLLSWLEQHDHRTYDYIIQGDAVSIKQFGGHGNAIAQGYNHMIMPLANRRDKETQVVWGIKDFERHYKRYPEAMWLPETAVDIETLEVLAQYHMKYVILAPRQAHKIRVIGGHEWTDVSSENIDTRVPYLIKLPSGARISAFFYNGGLSKAIAFDGLLHNGDTLANSILGNFSPHDVDNQLVHIATDGESYGHHHKNGDMALAYALSKIEKQPDVRLCNYGQFLELQPPKHEVQIFENSSWSCAHGVERWRSNCGCNSGGRPEWHQKWRAPLRRTLDELRDHANAKFEQSMEKFNVDQWDVRNDYINFIPHRTEASNRRFIEKWIPGFQNEFDQMEFVKSFELQRHLQLMYTSCAWFFDEASGIETVQVLQYAFRAVECAEDLWGPFLLDNFLQNLKTIPSNLQQYENGFGIFEQIVKKCRVGFSSIAAHYAVASLFKDQQAIADLYCYDAKKNDLDRIRVGQNTFVCGQAEFRSRNTHSKKSIMFAAIHLGENVVCAGVSLLKSEVEYQEFKKVLRQNMEVADLTAYMKEFDRQFQRNVFTLKDLLAEDRQSLARDTLHPKMEQIDAQYFKIYDENCSLVTYLSSLSMEMPDQLRVCNEYVVNKMIIRLFGDKIDDLNVKELKRYMDEATQSHLNLKAFAQGKYFQDRLIDFAETISSGHYNESILESFLFAIKFAMNIIPQIHLAETQYMMFKWRQGVEVLPSEITPIAKEIFEVLGIES